jgi:non-specific serine/threonine protein kinase
VHLALIPLALSLAAASWLTGPAIPEPRTEVAAATLRSEIVVVGGLLSSGGNSRRADAFAPGTGRWRRLPDLPVGVDHAAIASARGRVYVVGGYGADRSPLRAAYRFDGTRWQRLPPPPEPRAAAAAGATAAGKLYVVGGRDADGLATRALVLDLRTLRWSTVRGPTPREHLAAAVARGVVYAVAGRRAGIDTNLAAFEAFDPRTGRWRALAPVPEPRGGTGAATIAGRIVSVGGEAPEGTIASVYAYDLASRRWERLPDLPTPRHGLGVVSHSGRVWVIAGGPQPGLFVSDSVESLPLP